MWICPKCNREFKKENQSHYCGESPKTIDEYISRQIEEVQPFLKELRVIIKEAIPEAEERISWSMPTYYKDRNIIHFAANKTFVSIYVDESVVKHFENELKDYKVNKSTIKIAYNRSLDSVLIKNIAKWSIANGV